MQSEERLMYDMSYYDSDRKLSVTLGRGTPSENVVEILRVGSTFIRCLYDDFVFSLKQISRRDDTGSTQSYLRFELKFQSQFGFITLHTQDFLESELDDTKLINHIEQIFTDLVLSEKYEDTENDDD